MRLSSHFHHALIPLSIGRPDSNDCTGQIAIHRMALSTLASSTSWVGGTAGLPERSVVEV